MVLDRPLELDRVFHALAHPARRAILRRLTEGEQNLSELAAPLKMSFPAASKHVRVLEGARLVRRRIHGRSHVCRLEAQPLAEASRWLEDYRRIWEANFERLDDLLAEMQAAEQAPEAGGRPGAVSGGDAHSATAATAESPSPTPLPARPRPARKRSKPPTS